MDAQVLINYFAREGYWRHIQTACGEFLRKRSSDSVLLFWKSFGSLQEGSFSEALRELEPLQGQRDIELAAIAASIYAHSHSSLIDEEALSLLKQQLGATERSCSESALLQAALFHFHLGPPENLRKARDYLDQLLRLQPQNPEGKCLKAWIELSLADKGGGERSSYGGRNSGAEKALGIFEEVLAGGEKHLEAMLGVVKCWEVKREYERALEQINQVIVSHSWFVPGLAEKAKLLVVVGDWDQALEVAQRILTVDPTNIEALRLSALYLLSQECRPQMALKNLSDLLDSIDRTEPRNAAVYFESAQPLARLAGKSAPGLVQKTLTLVDRACKLSPGDARYIAELGYQQLLLGEAAGALSTYRRASQMDEMNMDAVYGTLFCQIALGQLQEAASHLDFLSEMSTSTDPSPPLLFLSATLARLKGGNTLQACALLDQAVEAHFRILRRVRPGLGFYAELEPDRLLDAAREFLAQGGTEPRGQAEPASAHVSQAVKVLEVLRKAAPGLLDVRLLLGRAKYLDADFEGAHKAVQGALEVESASAEASVLQSQIYLAQGKFKMAAAELEQAVAHDFCVRSSAHYNAVLAKVHLLGGEPEEAVKILESAMSLPGVRHVAKRQSMTSANVPGGSLVGLSDRVDIYLTLAAAQLKLGHVPEATKVVQDAMNEFAGTSEEVRVIIANCELSLSRGDTDAALAHLRAVPKDSPQYGKARVAMADILLKHRKNRAAYAQCYQELADRSRTPQSFVMLGEAYMRIQEPGKAIAAFQEALANNPNDPVLVSRIGRALVQTHSYSKAVAHYEAVLNGGHVAPSPEKSAMQYDLAALYFKLKKLDESERVLAHILGSSEGEEGVTSNDAQAQMQEVQALLLLIKVHHGRGRKEEAHSALLRARDVQNSVLAKTRLEQPETVRAQKQIAADIFAMLARDSESAKAPEEAAGFYNEGLKQSEGHVPTMLSLARLYLHNGDLDACQTQCTALLRIDSTDADASLMIADLMCRKEQYDSAVYHYQQLLEKAPCNYGALNQLIQLMRRCGRLSEVPPLFKNAEKANQHAEVEAGYHFCKGMYARCNFTPNEALKELNQARRDSEWSLRASYAMAEIYLNPENENLWEEGQSEAGEKAVPVDNAEAIKAAKKLLQEIATASRGPLPLRHTVLESYALMASKQKADIDAGLAKLHDVVKDDMESAPGLLAMATGFMLLKQSPKAKNILKRIQKMSYSAEDGDELERGWLMLADVYIHGGKHDAAQDLCTRCLRYNQSCGKAWEYLGKILEKSQSYKDAAEKYENAWRHTNEASPSVGYRLAYTYLKSKRLTESIDVCHKVIKASPNYPKIRKDVLEKARSQLRL